MKKQKPIRKREEFDFEEEPSRLLDLVLVIVAVLLIVALVLGGILLFSGKGKEKKEEVVEPEVSLEESEEIDDRNDEDSVQNTTDIADTDAEGAMDPQIQGNMGENEIGAKTDVREILTGDGAVETSQVTIGVDVSRYQGTIDWEEVAASGIDFAMIRAGYRTAETGEIVEDSNARYNLQEATANGIKAGVYFFSTAITEAEAIEEAKWVKELISGYKITYPVAYDCEGYEKTNSRQYGLTKEERTGLAEAFLKEIHAGGYTPMFYSAKSELENDSKWLTSELEQSYKIWVSWYPNAPFPETPKASYGGEHAMWQYTNNGTVAGVPKPVDVNVAYFGYEAEADAQGEAADQVEADVEALMNFTEVNEAVTAKDATNLRDIPSQGDDSTVMYTLRNGETATRTGVSDSGWSRVIYNGETYYAVSSYLTTDLSAKAPEPEVDDGIKTEFTAVNEQVTPKIEVNLRTLPSVTNPDAVVVATISNGDVITRTGINTDHGWSRVEYNGQVLYCISSYLYVVE